MVQYLTIDEVLYLHQALVDRYGGLHGVRDLGLVASAVVRPEAGFGDFEAYPDLFLKAAVLGFSLLKNHAFLDGNKRTSIGAMELLLEKNGVRITAKINERFRLAHDIENNSLPENQIAQWLKKHSKKIE